MTAAGGGPSLDGRAARLLSGFGFLYALVVTVLLLLLRDFFRDEPDSSAVLLWLLVPMTSSFGTWMAVRSGFAPLRAWIWFGIVATTFFCWIAVFSFGLLYAPVPILMMVAVVSPWDRPESGGRGGREAMEVQAQGWLWVSPVAQHGREVGYLRRLFGDWLLEGLLVVLTLGIGWLIWFWFEARRGQTPAKRLSGVKVHDYQTGEIAPAGKLWLREVVGKILLPAGIGIFAVAATGSEAAGGASQIYSLLGALLVLTSADGRTVWDHLPGTTVRLHT